MIAAKCIGVFKDIEFLLEKDDSLRGDGKIITTKRV